MNSRLGPDLRAMVWKEWRANFKWGLLGLLGVVLAAVYAILHAHGAESGYLAFGTVWTAAETVLTFAAPLLGLLLGLVQIVPEQRRDLWAFLIHRPASRSTIFWGKAIAGIGLLLLATLIPFLGFAIWMRVPGHYPAPFDWRLTLGGLISILSGLVFYFAGMLTALRPARWFGSRALPIPTAILSAAVLTESPTFMMALVLGIFFLTIVAAAAWGSFLTTGLYPRQPRPARFSLGVTVYLGLIVVIVTTAVVVTVSIANFFPPKPPKRSWESYEITKTGRVLRVTNTYGGDIIQAEDLAGRTVKHPNSEADFLQTQSLRPLSIDPSIGSEPYNSSSRYLTLLGTAGPLDSGTIWYYIVGARRIVAYSLHSRREIGRLGPEGFKADDAPQTVPGFREPLIQKQTDQFLMSRPLLVFPHSVSLFDTEAQTMVSLQTVLPPDQIRSLSVYTVGYLPDGRVPDGFAGSGFTRIFIGTDTEITVFTPLGKRLFTLPREYNFRDSCNVEIAMTNDAKRLFFRFTPLGKQAQLKHLPSYLDEVTMTRKLLNRYVLPPLRRNRMSAASSLCTAF